MTNRTRLVLLGSIACLVLFAGAVQMASASHEYQAPSQAPAASADQQAAEKAAAEKKATEKPYEEATYRTFPVVGSRVAIWMVAQLHLLFAAFVLAVPIFALIVEAIGYKTGDRRYDRLAREFTKLLSVSFSLTATFGAALTFMLIILYPKFTNYLMSVFSPTFLPYVRAVLLRGLLPLHLLLRLGEVPSPGASWSGARPQRGRHGHHVDRQFLAHVHDVSERSLEQRGAALPHGRDLQLHVDADQRPSRDRQRCLRRVGRRRLRGVQVPPRDNRRGARALRLDGIHRQHGRDQRLSPAAVRRLLAREGDLRLLADARPHDDGRGLLVALHHSGGPHREPVPRCQLLPLARHGAGRGRAAVPEVRQVLARRDRALLHGLGDAPVDHRDGLRDPGDGRIGAPGAGLPRCHVGEEHCREHPDPHDLHELPPLPTDGEDRDGVVGEDGPGGAAHDLRDRRDLRHLPRRLRVLRRGDGPHSALRAPGPLGPVRDGGDHRDRRLSLPRTKEDRRGALGQDPGGFAVPC